MAKKSIKKNYIYNILYEFLSIIIPLFTIPYLARVLGAENIGIYSYLLSISSYFILFGSLGIASYAKREIAYCQEDVKRRSFVFFEILTIKTILFVISLTIFYFSFCNTGQYAMYFRILILEVVSNLFDISWLFIGLEEFKKIVTKNTLVKIAGLICVFVFIKGGSDLNKYFLIYALTLLIGNVTMWLYLPKYINKIDFRQMKLKKHLKPTLALFIPQIATQVYVVLDKTMLGAMVLDKTEVGFYDQAQKIVKVLITFETSLGIVVAPRIAAIWSKGQKELIKKYLLKSFNFIFFLSFPMIFGLISVVYKFVPLFFGEGFMKVAPLICVISPIFLFIGLGSVTGTQYLVQTKQQSKYTKSVITGAIVNVFLNFILITKFQSYGASIATVIAELVVSSIQLYYIRKEIELKKVFFLTFKYILTSIIIFLISILIGLVINNSIISIVVQMLVSAVLYIIILFLLKDEFVISTFLPYKDRIFNNFLVQETKRK